MSLWLKALSAVKAYGLAIGAAAVVAAIALYVIGAEKAKGMVPLLEDAVVAAQADAKRNGQAVEQCIAANAANALKAVRQAERAREAEIALSAARALADRDVEVIREEVEVFRDRGLDCPALDNDFRRWVRDDP